VLDRGWLQHKRIVPRSAGWVSLGRWITSGASKRKRLPGFPIVWIVRTRSQDQQKLVVESVAFGCGYTAVLIWAGTALVASFTGGEANPYWPAIPGLRTDTTGALAFGVAIIGLVLSKYLELERRSAPPAEPAARPAGVNLVQAVAETAMVLGTGVVIYLSLNAVTHPFTLRLQLTHLWPWPSEGTVRVIALGVCLAAAAARRYLRVTAGRPGQAAAVESTDVAA
jgi:hypothetical protein